MQNNIKKLRKAKKMTQDELAEKIGSSKQHIWYLEKGYRKLTLDWIIKISKALNCSVQDLVCEEDLTEIKNSELPNNYKVEEKKFHPNIIYKLRK